MEKQDFTELNKWQNKLIFMPQMAETLLHDLKI